MRTVLRIAAICLIVLGIVCFCLSSWFMYKYRRALQDIISANNVLAKNELRILVDEYPVSSTEKNYLTDAKIDKRSSEAQANSYSTLASFFLAMAGVAIGLSGISIASLVGPE